jgi:hypothetical protein
VLADEAGELSIAAGPQLFDVPFDGREQLYDQPLRRMTLKGVGTSLFPCIVVEAFGVAGVSPL